MNYNANDPAHKSWVNVPEGSDFPIQNLPFGVFKTAHLSPRVGSRIGDYVVDLKSLFVLGYLENTSFELCDFDTNYLNNMMSKGKKGTRELRPPWADRATVTETRPCQCAAGFPPSRHGQTRGDLSYARCAE